MTEVKQVPVLYRLEIFWSYGRLTVYQDRLFDKQFENINYKYETFEVIVKELSGKVRHLVIYSLSRKNPSFRVARCTSVDFSTSDFILPTYWLSSSLNFLWPHKVIHPESYPNQNFVYFIPPPCMLHSKLIPQSSLFITSR